MRLAVFSSAMLLVVTLACSGNSSDTTPPPPPPPVPVPEAPTGLGAVGSSRHVALTWTASTGATSYYVKRGAAGVYQVIANSADTQYTDFGLLNGVSYTYVVSAVNAGGQSADTDAASADLTSYPNAFSTTADWSEEFNDANGTAPDATGRDLRWGYDTGAGGWGNGESEYYTTRSENVTITGGNLVITALKEDYSGSSYTSARLQTLGGSQKSIQYGKIEARIKIPKGQGIWPAFWMLGKNIGDGTVWPDCGEIDIMENIGREPGTVHGSLHGHNYSAGSALTGGTTLLNGVALGDDFHTYAIVWTQDSIQFFLDPNASYSNPYETRTAADARARGGAWAFNHPFFFILNVAVGGGWPGNPDGSTVFPQQMLVDYIRVYDLK